jgi:hypothetical protein
MDWTGGYHGKWSKPGSETHRKHVFSHLWVIDSNTSIIIYAYIYLYTHIYDIHIYTHAHSYTRMWLLGELGLPDPSIVSARAAISLSPQLLLVIYRLLRFLVSSKSLWFAYFSSARGPLKSLHILLEERKRENSQEPFRKCLCFSYQRQTLRNSIGV